MALCDEDSQFLADHVVDENGESSESAVNQVLNILKKMGGGHRGKTVVETDQDDLRCCLSKVVAKLGKREYLNRNCLPGAIPGGTENRDGSPVNRRNGTHVDDRCLKRGAETF